MNHAGNSKKSAKSIRVGFVSLGCAKNLVDSEVMLGLLHQDGFTITPDIPTADVAIVNTCGFLEASRKESIDQILGLVDYKSKGRLRHIVVAGCMVEKYASELRNELPEVDAWIGSSELNNISELLSGLDKDDSIRPGARPMEYPRFLYDHLTPRMALSPFYSRYVKISEGCNHACSFCIIPQIRGPYRSRSMESILAEVSELAEKGVREVNLISQETTYYGRDIDRSYHLPELLRRLNQIDGVRWIRLFYNHPQHLDPSILNAMADSKKVLPYLDLPLQHVNDRILRSMRRGVSKEQTVRLIQRIRNVLPECTLRTTFIVGYPDESEAEFEELCRFMEETRFHHAGVFTYSREMDSPSGHLPGQIPEKLKKQRYSHLMKIQQHISFNYNQSLVGQEEEVLIEGADEGRALIFGRSRRHAPDVDGRVYIASNRELRPGALVKVRITEASPYDVMSEFVSHSGAA